MRDGEGLVLRLMNGGNTRGARRFGEDWRGERLACHKSSGYSREAVLATCLVLLAGMFGVTAFVTRTYHKRIHTLADDWYAEGNQALESQKNEEAVTDFRNALVYSPNNPIFQFHLAQALIAAGHTDDAQDYLLNLLSEMPGNGEINLSLARIAAQKNSMTDALRYYHSAIYGGWEKDAVEMRWRARQELCEFLLARNDTNQAEAEVIALADDTPRGDVGQLDAAGNLLLQTQLWSRALDEFRLALAADRHDAGAIAGLGTASFQLGRYTPAVEYFERLPKGERAKPEIARMLDVARQVLSADPFQPELSARERARRTAEALTQAKARTAQCTQTLGQPLPGTPAMTDLQKAYAAAEARKRDWTEIRLTIHPDEIEEAMRAAFQLENAAAQKCGEPQSGPDMILRLLERERRNSNP
jgi:predicted Zn-dependent protease